MQILDLNQVLYSTIVIGKLAIEENLLRHVILNIIRSNKVRFQYEYGSLIIALDNKRYWRRTIFPPYKANRKKIRDQSLLNWEELFKIVDQIKLELKTYFPYPMIDVDGAEADDVIATLVKSNIDDKYLILSGDKDFIQLHNDNIQQWDITRKRWIVHPVPKNYLYEHIIRGDIGDGIPNILSDDTCLMNGIRQKRITEKFISQLSINNMETKIQRNYSRNKQLIDFNNIPIDIQSQIIEEYNKQKETKNGTQILNYFIKYKMNNLMSSLSDF